MIPHMDLFHVDMHYPICQYHNSKALIICIYLMYMYHALFIYSYYLNLPILIQ